MQTTCSEIGSAAHSTRRYGMLEASQYPDLGELLQSVSQVWSMDHRQMMVSIQHR